MRTIVVEPYRAEWKDAFREIEAFLKQGLGQSFVAIEHVGSTAVEGLAAKPIIDIDIVIEHYGVFQTVKTKLEALGYYHNGDQGIKTREAFKYKKTPFMTHHLYVCPKDSMELKKHLAFKAYLVNHADAKEAYAAIKYQAAAKYKHDIDGYLNMKGVFIQSIYKRLGL